MAIRETTYFESRGPENTDETLRLAKKRADELGIRQIVVASATGETGEKTVGLFKGSSVVVVAGVVGFKQKNEVRLRDNRRLAIEEGGGKILLAGHAFGMLGRAVRNAFGAMQIDEIIANVLRIFGPGVKVCCEVACMAADAGLVRAGEETIAIAGSAHGADAAVVLKPSNTHTFFDTRVMEIICKPRE
jgi:hypothetical protein